MSGCGLRMSAQVSALTPRGALCAQSAHTSADFPTALPPPTHHQRPRPSSSGTRHSPCVLSPQQKLVPPLVGPFGHVWRDKRCQDRQTDRQRDRQTPITSYNNNASQRFEVDVRVTDHSPLKRRSKSSKRRTQLPSQRGAWRASLLWNLST